MIDLKNLAILALFGILLAGCAVSPGLDPNPAPGVRLLHGEVAYVIDGDTVVVTAARHRFRVRLLGIDAPEDTRRHECFGAQATAGLRHLLPAGAQVRLDMWRHPDRYDRTLAFVWRADGLFVNQVLLRRGYATTLFLERTYHRGEFVAAERLAQRHRAGIWHTCRPRAPPGGHPGSGGVGHHAERVVDVGS